MTIVLASASPRRRQLMEDLGIPFEVRPSHIEEDVSSLGSPGQAARELALQKARAVAGGGETELVIGADTLVVYDHEILGKPDSQQEARRMLKLLRGRTHLVVTGLAIVYEQGRRHLTSHVTTRVRMRRFRPWEIEEYVSTKEPFDKAGSYAIQGLGAHLVESIQGCYLNVVGLPICELQRLLAAAGTLIPPGCFDQAGDPCRRLRRI